MPLAIAPTQENTADAGRSAPHDGLHAQPQGAEKRVHGAPVPCALEASDTGENPADSGRLNLLEAITRLSNRATTTGQGRGCGCDGSGADGYAEGEKGEGEGEGGKETTEAERKTVGKPSEKGAQEEGER